MTSPREARLFPQLQALPADEQIRCLDAAKRRVFGPQNAMARWRGNLTNFALMFAVSAVFMGLLVPALSLSRDVAAILMLLVVLPAFFIMQQRRYVSMIRQALKDEANEGP
ncbi:MAG TPA: hypothetical protein VIC08_14615 [Cellvibrionaceae bacterium]